MKYIKLNNGLEMPIIGLGTYPLNRLKLVKSMLIAYKNGYLSYDTSSAYGNEFWLGVSLRILRYLGAKNIFVTTKLSNADQRSGNVRKALLESMKRLGLNQIDLYLMHWPNPETYLDCWKQMEELYKEGLVKAIGVCNFHEHHLETLLKTAKIIPAINQVELHPLLTQNNLRAYCNKHGIHMQAYSPVARMHPRLINNQSLNDIAKKYDKSVPQVVLRWNVQNEIIAIPKSGVKARIRENIDVFNFELSLKEMTMIDNLNEDFRVRHNPDNADFSKL